MKKFFKDFKTFIARGNILDMAVGVIIGNAFSKIVTSLVNNIIMPLLAGAIGNSSVADLKWVMHPAVTDEAGNVIKAEAAVAYGTFLQAIIDFLLIALCLFIVLRIVMNISNKLRRDPDGYTNEEYLKLRKEGHKRKEIKAMEEKKIAEAREARANAPKPETTDSILKDIRDLLKTQSEQETK